MKVEFLDADSDGFIHEQDMVVDPRLSPIIELRRNHNDYAARLYQVVPDRGRMKLAMDSPDKISLVVYLREMPRR